jgi:hypothetical protein
MSAPGIGITQKEDRECVVDQQHIFHRMALVLAAIIARLLSRILGTPDAPLGAIMPTRGEAGTGAAAGGSGGFGGPSTGTTIALASASGHPEALRQLCHRPGGRVSQCVQRCLQDA